MGRSHQVRVLAGIFMLMALLLPLCMSPVCGNSPGSGTRAPKEVLVSAPAGQSGAPTDVLEYVFNVSNVGDENDTYNANATSEHGWPVAITDPPGNFTLVSGASRNVTVQVTIPSGANGSLQDTLWLNVSSETGGPGASGQAVTTVDSAFVLEMEVEGGEGSAASQVINPGWQADFVITFTNMGNLNASLTIHYIKSNASWNLTLSHDLANVSRASEGEDPSQAVLVVSIEAPADAWPGDSASVEIWFEDADDGFVSWKAGIRNITLTAVISTPGEPSETGSEGYWTPWIFGGYLALIAILSLVVVSAYFQRGKREPKGEDEDEIDAFIKRGKAERTGPDEIAPPPPLDEDPFGDDEAPAEEDFAAVPENIEIEPPEDLFGESRGLPPPEEDTDIAPPSLEDELEPREKAPPMPASSLEIQSAREELDRLDKRVIEAKGSGMRTDAISDLMAKAHNSLAQGDVERVKNYMKYAEDRLANASERHDKAHSEINAARQAVTRIRGKADISVIQNFLLRAETLFEKGEYREAQSYARKARDRAKLMERNGNGQKHNRV